LSLVGARAARVRVAFRAHGRALHAVFPEAQGVGRARLRELRHGGAPAVQVSAGDFDAVVHLGLEAHHAPAHAAAGERERLDTRGAGGGAGH